MRWISSLSEKPVHHRLRILAAPINLTDAQWVHLVFLPIVCVSVTGVFVKAAYGKPYVQFERRTVVSAQVRLLRPDTDEAAERERESAGGGSGGKDPDQGERGTA